MTDARHKGTDFSLPAQAAAAVTDLERGFVSSVNGLTAHAGGGQASATALTASINRVTVCATAADSVALPAAKAGACITVINAGAASANVFPVNGGTDSINALAANAAFAVANGKTCEFLCANDGVWHTNLSA